MHDQIKSRYEKGYVTGDQLDRYVALGAITEEQAQEIRSGSEPEPPEGTIETAALDAAYKEGVNSYE